MSVVFPEPTLNELPMLIVLGIDLTEISWTNPATLPMVIASDNCVLSVLTPTLKAFVKFVILVLKPDIETASWSFNSINGKYFATTSFWPLHSNTALLNGVITVSIRDIPIPTISLTDALNPEPFVSSSSNSVKSPIL